MDYEITQFSQDKGITKCSQNTQKHTVCFIHSGSSTRITLYLLVLQLHTMIVLLDDASLCFVTHTGQRSKYYT